MQWSLVRCSCCGLATWQLDDDPARPLCVTCYRGCFPDECCRTHKMPRFLSEEEVPCRLASSGQHTAGGMSGYTAVNADSLTHTCKHAP